MYVLHISLYQQTGAQVLYTAVYGRERASFVQEFDEIFSGGTLTRSERVADVDLVLQGLIAPASAVSTRAPRPVRRAQGRCYR